MATRTSTDETTGQAVQHSTLTPFDGRTVASASLAITNAGDGLSQALAVEAREFHIGDVVDVLIRCEVTKVGHLEIKDTDLLNRVHTLKAGVGTIVDAEFAETAIVEQQRKNDEAKGVLSLDLDADGEPAAEDA